jgi:hypothetical protein
MKESLGLVKVNFATQHARKGKGKKLEIAQKLIAAWR